MKFHIPEITIKTIDEAKAADKELWALQSKLRTIIDREESKKTAPVVKMLNRLLARGSTLYFEYGDYRGITQKSLPDAFRQKKNGGIAHCTNAADVERHYTIDRIFVLHKDNAPELVYERNT